MGSESNYDLAGQVIGMAMRVHTMLGPGFLESVYRNALMMDLAEPNLHSVHPHSDHSVILSSPKFCPSCRHDC